MLNLIKLENRIVLDGAGAGEAADHAADQDAVVASGNDAAPDHHPGDDYSAQVAEAAAMIGDGDAGATDASEGLEIVLISDSLPDYQTLVDAVDPDAVAIVYDADTESADDVIGRVTDLAAQEGKQIDSLTIMSHGGAGYFTLGKEMVTSENLENYSDDWSALDDHMKDDGQIYVYGCNVVNGSDAGQNLLDGLAEATNTSVYGSDDYTGNGGDWDLEAHSENAQDISNPPLDKDHLSDYTGLLTTDIPLQITVLEDNLGSYQLLIYGPGENAGSQNANSIILTGYDTNAFTQASLQYDGWITNQPRVINGVTISEYHQWTTRFDPAQDVNHNIVGNADIFFSLASGGNATTEVTIIPVNDAPEFTMGPDIVIDEDSPSQTVPNQATNIRPGPITATDEVNQNLDFIVTNDNNSLFLVQPFISDNGTLTYTPAPDMNGVATVTVTLKDDGGTAFGGQDTSAPQQFTITINPVNDPPDAPNLNPITYVENNSPTHLDVTLGTDPDDTHLSKAEVTFVSNYQQGEDVLNYTTINGITGSWNASTGTLTLTGNATIAQYQQALRSVTYGDPANDDPTEGTRALRVTITDANSSGGSNGPQSSSSQTTLFVDAVNDAPDLEAETGSIDYDEDSGPQVIDDAFQLSDVDDDNMTRATIQITSGYVNGEDVLAFTNTSNITGSWNAGTGTLTLTGLASEAAYQAALRTVTYENTNTSNPDTTTRQITFTIRDNNSRGFGDGPNGTGGFMTDAVIRTVNINATPDPPTRPDTNPLDMTEDSDNPNQINDDGSYAKLPNDGELISDIVNPFTDPDTGQTLQSIAITGVDDTNGTWQYSLNNGATWTPIQTANNAVSETNALLLDQNARLRFVPNENFNTRTTSTQVDGVNTPTLTIKSWDQSSGSEGQYVNTVNDPAFSPGSSSIEMEVLAVNDQPVLDVGDGEVDIEDYRVAQAIDGITTDDIDLNEFLNQAGADTGKVEVTLTAAKGVISISQTNGLDAITGNGTSAVTLKGDLALVQTAISANSLSYQANQSDAEDFIQNGDITQAFDTLNIKVDDIGNYGLPHQRDVNGQINLFLKNLAPVVDLDEDDSGSTPSYPDDGQTDNPDFRSPNFRIVYVEDTTGHCPPVNIADADAIVTDPDSQFIHSMTVIVTNIQEGDEIGYDDSIVQANNLLVTQEESNGQLVLRFEGNVELPDGNEANNAYSSLLRTITFQSTSENPSDVQRLITVQAADLDEQTGGDGNVSEIVTSYVTVVPVNDAPIVDTPSDLSTPINVSVSIGDVHVEDYEIVGGDRVNPNILVSATLTVTNGTIEVASGDDVNVSGNGSRQITIQNKTMEDLDNLLDTIQYTPLSDFNGEDTLTIAVNDQGHAGVNPDSHVTACNTLNESNISADTISGAVIVDGKVPAFKDGGTVTDPSRQITTKTINIRVRSSDPQEPTEPETPIGPPLTPITKPDADPLGGINLGLVRLPGPVGETSGVGVSSRDIPGIDGPLNWDFCSIDDALRIHLGCRFANTLNPEAKIGAASWADLGQTRPFLDEEYDLFRQLFIREADDPGFNIPAETFDTDHGGLPAQAEQLFDDGVPGESLKDMEGGEIKKAFFQGREELDKTWSRIPLRPIWNK